MGGITIVFVLYNHNAIIVHIKVMVVGGLTNNILAPQYVEKQHAEKVIHNTSCQQMLIAALSVLVFAHCSLLSGYIGHGSNASQTSAL